MYISRPESARQQKEEIYARDHLDDLHVREVSGRLQVFGVAKVVEAVAQDAKDLVFPRRPRATELLETVDELGDLPRRRTEVLREYDTILHFVERTGERPPFPRLCMCSR